MPAPSRPQCSRSARAVAACLVLGAVYLRLVRPWTMRAGATDEEASRPLPGDPLVPGAGYQATRAITVHATSHEVWPWLVQMGSGRAGWYALDRLDNGGVPSAEVIVPELQHLDVGDPMPMVPGTDIGPRVVSLEPERRMLLASDDEMTWEWLLQPVGAGDTRLLNRIRERYPPLFSRRMLYAAVASSGDVVMNRRQLRGIKRRAERHAQRAVEATVP